jgi:hypothetical protein
MKKLITLIIVMISTFGIASAQVGLNDTNDEYDAEMYGRGKMPFNSDNQVVFSKVVEVENQTSDNIYKLVRKIAPNCFDNDKVSIIDKDDEKQSITINAWMYTLSHGEIVSAMSGIGFKCFFTVRVQCKDGRYRIDVFNLKGHRDEYRRNFTLNQEENVAAEVLNDKVCLMKNGKVRDDINGVYRRMIIDCATSVIYRIENNLSTNISKGDIKSNDNW